jgi:expansin (peptidoglycan-binding protein)
VRPRPTTPPPSTGLKARLAPRWLATGGAVVLAGVLGVALLLQNGGSACAAVPSTTASSGKATFYDLAGGMGNCSFPSAPADDLFVALGASDYDGAAACGSYLDVTGPKGKVRVKVIDSCPPCGAGHIDLSRTAFKRIGNEIDGIIKVKYKLVRGASAPAPVTVRVKEGSSRFWLAVLIDNHANPLASVTIGGKAAKRADFNYWIVEGGAGSGPFTIRIRDVYGVSTTLSGVDLSPGRTQKTGVRAGGSGSAPEPAAPKKAPKAKPSPSRSAASASPSPSAPAPVATEAAAVVEPPVVEPEVDLAAGPSSSCD